MDSESLRRSRTLLRNVLSLDGRAQRAVGSVVALAAGSALVAAAHAQTACATTSCELAEQTALTTLLSPFTTLPGTAAWTANYEVQQNIYLNSTYAQRVQSAQHIARAFDALGHCSAMSCRYAAAQSAAYNNPSPFAANVRAALTEGTDWAGIETTLPQRSQTPAKILAVVPVPSPNTAVRWR